MNMPPQSRSGREYIAPSAEVDAAVDALLGKDVDTLKRLLALSEEAYTDKYCGITDTQSLPIMRAYCEPWMVMRLFDLVRIGAIKSVASENRTQEGYPGIAHDFETMRSALVQIRDECFNGHAHDIAEAALNAAPQRSTAKDSTGPSQEGLGQGDAAVAAPASSVLPPMPAGEDAQAYNAKEMGDALKEFVDPVERDRLAKVPWARSLVNELVKRIINLRRINAANSATSPTNSTRARHIEGFRDLNANWDSYGAEKLTEETIQLALRVSAMLGDEWKVIPCADGPSAWFFRGNEDEIIKVWASTEGRDANG